MTHFTGRTSECEKIIAIMTSKSTRLLNICGPPGFGKTSSAIAAGHKLQLLGYSVYFSTFRGINSKNEFISKLLSFFRRSTTSPSSATLTLVDQLCCAFGEISSPFIVIADNLDDILSSKKPNDNSTAVVKDEVVHIIEEILGRCQNVGFIVTTRESLQFLSLKMEGFRSIRIGPLDQHSSANLVHKFLPSVAIDVSTRITQLCGCVPLAVKLMCSLIHEINLAPTPCLDHLLESSQSVVQILDNSDYPNDLRLRILFESSFNLLSQSEQEAFISLSIFASSEFDSNAASAVIGGNETVARRTLNNLVRKCLIDLNSQSQVFSIHPLLRSFAIEKGENELKEVTLSSRIRFYNYYVLLFKELNEKFLNGEAMMAFVKFYEEEQNIWVSFYESLLHEEVRKKLFDVLARAELFLSALYLKDLETVESLYDMASKKAHEQKNHAVDLALFVSKCFCKTLLYSRNKTMVPDDKETQERFYSLPGGTGPKYLCYQGIYALSNGRAENGIQLIQTGFSDLSSSSDERALKFLTSQLLALYYFFSKDTDKSRQFNEVALDFCEKIGNPSFFLIAELGNEVEENKLRTPCGGTTSPNQPFMFWIISLVSVWAREYLTVETKKKLSNIVLQMQKEIEVSRPGWDNTLANLLHIGDLALVFLGTGEAAQMDETTKPVGIAIERQKSSVNQDKEDCEMGRKNTKSQKLQRERLATYYFRTGVHFQTKEEYTSALQAHQHALDIRLELYGEQHTKTADSYRSIGIVQNNMGNYKSALESHIRALEIRLKLYGEKHAKTANSYLSIGNIQDKIGNYTLALQSFQRALEIRLQLYGEKHGKTAKCFQLIGYTQDNMGDYIAALNSYQHALNISLELNGEQHAKTADSYHSIGTAQFNLGNFTSALQSLQHTLSIRLKLLAENYAKSGDKYKSEANVSGKMEDYISDLQTQHNLDLGTELHDEQQALTADCYHNIGIIQDHMGDCNSALRSHQSALDIALKIYGEEHTKTADSYQSIGSTQNNRGDFPSSLQSHRRALVIVLKLFGEDNAKTAECYQSIGSTQNNMGKFTSALLSLQRALDIGLKVHGEQHAAMADCYHNIGVVQGNMEHFASALQSHCNALDIRLKQHGDQHVKTADSYQFIGSTQYKMKDYTSAFRSHQRALKIRLKLYGEKHEKTADSYQSMGCTQNNIGDFTSALQLLERARDILLELYGEHARTASCYYNIGIVQGNKGELISALQSHEHELCIRLKFYGEKHAKTADSYHHVGSTQNLMGKYTCALQSLQRALDIRLELYSEQHPVIAECYRNIGIVQRNRRDFSSALKSFQRAYDIRKMTYGEQHEKTVESYHDLNETMSIRKKCSKSNCIVV